MALSRNIPRSTTGKHRSRSVFLSHNRNDQPFVRRVHNELNKRQIQNWYAEAELLPGDSLIDKIEQAITNIDYLAVFVSDDSVKSTWVKKEVNAALSREIAGHRIKVIPLIIGGIRDSQIPAMLAEKYYIDFRSPNPFEKGISELLMVLDDLYAESITEFIRILETPDEFATAVEGILSAGGVEEIAGVAELYKYNQIYEKLGIKLPDTFQMYENKPEGAIDRLARDLKRDLPYPLWDYLANPEMLRRILRGFGKDL